MENRFATIRDVAADANVSTATVSRALNEPWRVSLQTRERVKASAEKLGYRPNFRARLLAKGEAGTICFLLSNRPFVHSVHSEILQGAAREADLLDVQIVYATCTYSPNTPPADIEMPRILAARQLIDGVIVAGTNYYNGIKVVEQLELPYVVFGTNLVTENGDYLPNAVYVDDEEGGYKAAEHLISLGHKRIYFIGDLSKPWYRRRYKGYAKAMKEAGLKPAQAVGSADDGEYQMGYEGANELLDRGYDFTALFVAGDMGALGAIRALRNQGLSIPDDVSIVGFNDEEVAQIADPPLTTVRSPNEEVGAKCVEMLLGRIRKEQEFDEAKVLPVELVVRESTAAPGKTKGNKKTRATVRQL